MLVSVMQLAEGLLDRQAADAMRGLLDRKYLWGWSWPIRSLTTRYSPSSRTG